MCRAESKKGAAESGVVRVSGGKVGSPTRHAVKVTNGHSAVSIRGSKLRLSGVGGGFGMRTLLLKLIT